MAAQAVEPVVTLARVRAEIRREVVRPRSLGLVAGFVGLCTLLALFAVTQAGLKVYTPAVYLFVPLAMAPVAAHSLARDRDRHVGEIHATTPLGPGEALLGKALGLAAVWVLALAASLPLLYVLASSAATGAFLQLAPLLAWGLVLGLVSLLAGLIVGYLHEHDATRAVSSGFLLVLGWALLALQRGRLYSFASNETQLALARGLAHASPVTWALGALQANAAYLAPGHASLLAGLALLAVPLAAALAALAVGLQRLAGWRSRPLACRNALAVLGLALVAAGLLLVSWNYPSPSGSGLPSGPSQAQTTLEGTQVRLVVEDDAEWGKGSQARAHLFFTGPRNASLHLQELHLEAENLRLEPDVSLPQRIVLEGKGSEGGGGRASLTVPVTLTPLRLVNDEVVTAEIVVDGEAATLEVPLSPSSYRLPLESSMAVGGLTLALATATAIAGPRRMNAW